MVLGQTCSKLACFSSRETDIDSVLAHEKKLDTLRDEGQQQLRAMLGNAEEGVDWKAVISKANELQEQERIWMQERERKDREKRNKRSLARRRHYDRTGSFSVNLFNFQPSKKDYRLAVTDDEMSAGLLSRARTRETRSQAESHESAPQRPPRRGHRPISIRTIEIKL